MASSCVNKYSDNYPFFKLRITRKCYTVLFSLVSQYKLNYTETMDLKVCQPASHLYSDLILLYLYVGLDMFFR